MIKENDSFETVDGLNVGLSVGCELTKEYNTSEETDGIILGRNETEGK